MTNKTSCEKCRYLILQTTIRGSLCFKGHNLKDVSKKCNSFDGSSKYVGIDFAYGESKSVSVEVTMEDGKITNIN